MLDDIIAVQKPSEFELLLHAFPWRKDKSKRRRSLIRVRCNTTEQRNEWYSAIQERLHEKWKEAEKIIKLVEQIEVSAHYTEYQGHAELIVDKIQIGMYSGIICVSGDGLIHEVINGLMRREDWE